MEFKKLFFLMEEEEIFFFIQQLLGVNVLCCHARVDDNQAQMYTIQVPVGSRAKNWWRSRACQHLLLTPTTKAHALRAAS